MNNIKLRKIVNDLKKADIFWDYVIDNNFSMFWVTTEDCIQIAPLYIVGPISN